MNLISRVPNFCRKIEGACILKKITKLKQIHWWRIRVNLPANSDVWQLSLSTLTNISLIGHQPLVHENRELKMQNLSHHYDHWIYPESDLARILWVQLNHYFSLKYFIHKIHPYNKITLILNLLILTPNSTLEHVCTFPCMRVYRVFS